MGFTVYVASDSSREAHKTIYGGSPDKDAAIAMCKTAVSQRVAGKKTIGFVIETDDSYRKPIFETDFSEQAEAAVDEALVARRAETAKQLADLDAMLAAGPKQ